jgi:hypothetical protein
MQPVYVGAWIDQEQRDGAVWFLFSGYRCQADHDMRLLRYLAQHRRRIVGRRRETLEQLTSSHQDLVRSLASPAAATHAIGQHSEQASWDAWVCEYGDLVLLVLAVTFVDSGGGGESIACGHEGSVREALVLD